MSIIIDEKYKWKQLSGGKTNVWYIDSERNAKEFLAFSQRDGRASPEKIESFVKRLSGNFAFIAESHGWCVAAVDKVRSYPLFYSFDGGRFSVSNSAKKLRDNLSRLETDSLSLLEFRMAGYVSGRGTLFKHLYQLQAGELLIWDAENHELSRRRYYLFYPKGIREQNRKELIEELGERTDQIFKRVVLDAVESPIWVPVSGGLDSRLVLCKLKQHGHRNLHAFSYGPPRNDDAKWGGRVAKKLGVPWLYIPYRVADVKRFFFSGVRKNYWSFSEDFASTPFMVDEYALYYLKKNGLMPPNAIIINGQTGDFISGGHSFGYHSNITPDDRKKYGRQAVISAVVKKHYSLNRSLMTRENLERISEKIVDLLGIQRVGEMDAEEVTKYYELWEWQGRQSKYVVNGQRSYDFFGHRWYLPLWADEYMEFWPQIAFRHRFKQHLYKDYLEKMDAFGLFRSFKPVVWSWQGPSMLALPVGATLKRLFGRPIAERFYHYASYFGKYQNHYAPFGFLRWLGNAGKIKSPISFYAETYLKEKGIR